MEKTAEIKTEEKVQEKAKAPSPAINDLQKELEGIKEPENKLQKAIDCMETSLSQHGNPNFKLFWESRKLCLDLFKEQMAPSVRSIHWARYSELSKEAYRLKEILDEQSAFAVEQIEIAIDGIEKEIEQISQQMNSINKLAFPENCTCLKQNFSLYGELQSELNLLNVQASRITALRKELIRTQMRVKQKNKFFKRLSLAGDKVFPRRKELIKKVSDHFISDIDRFVTDNFDSDNLSGPLFSLREEIKALQSVAKILTLNSHSFANTRSKLSECWDKLKEAEKERKKVRSEKFEEFKKNAEGILEKIKTFAEDVKEGTIKISDADKHVDEIFREMKQTDLGRDEVRMLREELTNAQKPILEKKKEEEEKRRELEREREKQRQEKLEAFKGEITNFHIDINDIDPSKEKVKEFEKEIKDSNFNSSEKYDLKNLISSLKDTILEKVEEALLNLPDDVKEAIEQLKKVLQQRNDRRQKVKEQLETYRKQSGGSGLDFEQSMKLNELIAEDKQKLEKIDQSIEEVETQIRELKK